MSEPFDWREYSRVNDGELETVLSVKPAGRDFKVTVQFRNKSDRELHLDKYDVPRGGLTNNYFDVRLGGEEVPYYGPMVSRGAPPGPDGFVDLAPGKTLVAKFNLKEFYRLEQNAKGTLTLAFLLYDKSTTTLEI